MHVQADAAVKNNQLAAVADGVNAEGERWNQAVEKVRQREIDR